MKSNISRNVGNSNGQEFRVSLNRNSKMTPEMFQAIRRQETVTGVDYWRVGSGLGLTPQSNGTGHPPPNAQDSRRQTFNRLTQINLDFPGTFLPNVATNQQQRALKRKPETGGQTIVLNRSRTSVMPNIQPAKPWESTSVTPTTRKAVMTDLSCMQLADTLFSSKKSPFAGFFNFSPTKSRYMDYFGDEKDSDDDIYSESESESSKYTTKLQTPDQRKAHIIAMKYQTFQADDTKVRHMSSPVYQSTGALELIPENKKEMKPQKSILKNAGDRVTNGNSGEILSNKFYHLPNKDESNKDSHIPVTVDSIHPKLQSSSCRKLMNERQRNPKLEYTLTGVVHDLTARKRSVRFNAAHEIREYTPCEPMSY